MKRRRESERMTLADLRDLLDREAPFTGAEPGESELGTYMRVADERARIGAEHGFNRIDVIRTRLAHLWGY